MIHYLSCIWILYLYLCWSIFSGSNSFYMYIYSHEFEESISTSLHLCDSFTDSDDKTNQYIDQINDY